MTELEKLKARAAERREGHPDDDHAPSYRMTSACEEYTCECVAEAEADLDRAIAIAEELIQQRNQWYSAWRSDEPVIDQLAQERDQARAEVEEQRTHLLAWDKWFAGIVDSFISQGAERKQARDDVLKLRGEWLPLSTLGHNEMTSMTEGICNTWIAELVKKWLTDTEHYEQYR